MEGNYRASPDACFLHGQDHAVANPSALVPAKKLYVCHQTKTHRNDALPSWPGASLVEHSTMSQTVRYGIIARQIYDTPAAGPAGLAIKAFMLALEVCIDDVDRPSLDEPASLGKFDLAQNHCGAGDRLYVRNHAIRGLAGDIARFVPELAPLVAGIVQSPVKRSPDRAEDRAAGPPPSAHVRRAIRELVDKWDAEAGGDGDNAA